MEKLVKYGQEFVFYISLKTAGSDSYQVNPTLAAGDVKVTQDGVNFGNIDTIPVVAPAGGTQVKVTVSVAELTGKQTQIQFIDAAGAEWKAATINIETYAHADAQHPYRGEGLFDRILASATHNIKNSAGRRIRELLEIAGYEGGFIYYDSTGGGSAGSTPFENGTLDDPVDNMADLNILLAALPFCCIKITSGSSITFAASQEHQSFIGENWTLILNEQSISGSFFHGADVSGIATGAVKPKFEDCDINGTTLPPSIFKECGYSGNFIAGSPGDYYFTNDSHSRIAGIGAPTFSYNAAIGAVNFNFRGYHGGQEIKEMRTGDNLSFDGDGQIIINADSLGGTMRIAGHQSITGAAAFIAAGGFIYDDARFAMDQLADVGTILTLVTAIDTSSELAARFDEIKGPGWIDETLRSIRTAIGSIGGIQGANAITIQIYETDTTTPIVDDTVAIWNSDQSLMLGTAKTDPNGQISIGLDDGTYKIVSQKAGIEFTVPETMVVTIPATFTYYGTPETYPVPSNPDACNVICDLKDFGLAAKEGVTFTARLTTTPQAVNGAILNAEAWSRDTDATGRAILTLPQGVKFTIFSIALGGDSKTIRIDTAALSSLILADQV